MKKLFINSIKELMEEREKCLALNLEDKHWNKLKGNINPGSKIIVTWKEYPTGPFDFGYVFCTPECYSDEGDMFIHFQQTINPGGMDSGPEVYDHLYYLMINPEIVSIKENNN
jgi:hypothetical protein